MKKLILAGAIVASLATAPTAAAVLLPGATYTGTTTDGGTVSVQVAADGESVGFQALNFGQAGCTGNGLDRYIPISGNGFYHSEDIPSVTISGTFTSPGVVVGIVRLSFVCDSGYVSWTASAATSWADLTIRRSGERASKALGEGVYNETARDQTREWTVKRGKKRAFKVDLQNDGTEAGDFALRGCKGSGGVAVSYKLGGKDVTSKVTSKNGHKVKALGKAAKAPVKVVLKAAKNAKKGKRKACKITAQTAAALESGSQLDAAKAVVTVR